MPETKGFAQFLGVICTYITIQYLYLFSVCLLKRPKTSMMGPGACDVEHAPTK